MTPLPVRAVPVLVEPPLGVKRATRNLHCPEASRTCAARNWLPFELSTIPATVFGFASSFAYLLQTPDVLKVDIQGGEYDLFDEADDATLRRCRLITIERHAWTTSDEQPVEGWGVSDARPMCRGAYDAIVTRMERTHHVEIEGDTLFCYETP